MAMEIKEVLGNRKRFLPLLLLADEQESMIERYLERGAMYVLDDGGVRAECIVVDAGEGNEPAFIRRIIGLTRACAPIPSRTADRAPPSRKSRAR